MRRQHHPSLALALLLTVSVAARADKVDDYVKAEMQKQHVPGLSLAVIKEGRDGQGRGLRPGEC